MKKKLLITNTVYGQTYAQIFCDFHLRTMLDPSNIPAVKGGVEYVIFTDSETEPYLRKHPNILRLLSNCETNILLFDWKPGLENDKFLYRYSLITRTLIDSITLALEKNMLLAPWVADLVFAEGFLPNVLSRIEQGHDAVFTLPMRGTFESMALRRGRNNVKTLDQYDGAPSDIDLFEMAYTNMHHLWSHCHWDNPQFTSIPYTLLWNSGKGLLAHSYSVTPIVFDPTPQMAQTTKVLDVQIPGMCKNPYWAHDWIDAPVAGCEPQVCYFPVFNNNRRAGRWIAEWSGHLEKTQHRFLHEPLYYPSRDLAEIPMEMVSAAQTAIKLIGAFNR